MKMVVSVYKTKRKEGLYLYINKLKGLDSIPEQLRTLMGQPQHVVDFLLTPERNLAEADSAEVLSKINETGYYLQMPPAEQKDDYMITLPDEFLSFNDPQ
ncbi:YcgL domain-containing protein [Parendozoicomonas haliclonae]|uniref:YcgL domain-containing protein EHSB41UT_03196 n=1 Tax=Parendozoicomonas haliclonae TaxID=1960125 RepID=A0A1X7AM83_9GAMM|nr:YcgL domain-containing protein [Parendozoicomonas haliclonae]SMA49344.1 Protein YcgL [Parendozoicomonas haliclonae]